MSEDTVVTRLWGLDMLRLGVIWAVVVLHASMSYMAFAPEWWYVVDGEGSLGFTLVVLAVDAPIMLILFYLAGYFAQGSLERRGAAGFLKAKALRVGLPWLLGVLLLAPPTAYMILYSRGSEVSLLEFWGGLYWGSFYQQSVYWFLGVLMALFVLLALLSKLKLLRGSPPVHTTGVVRFAVPILGSVTFFLVHRTVPLDTWSHAGYLLMYQPNRAPLYLIYFFFGFYCARRGWLGADGYRPRRLPWTVAASLFLLAYLADRLAVPGEARLLIGQQLITSILINGYIFSGVMAALAWASRAETTPPRWLRSQARHSYTIYYLHPLLLYPAVLALSAYSLPAGMKFLIAVLATVAVAWAAAAAVATGYRGAVTGRKV